MALTATTALVLARLHVARPTMVLATALTDLVLAGCWRLEDDVLVLVRSDAPATEPLGLVHWMAGETRERRHGAVTGRSLDDVAQHIARDHDNGGFTARVRVLLELERDGLVAVRRRGRLVRRDTAERTPAGDAALAAFAQRRPPEHERIWAAFAPLAGQLDANRNVRGQPSFSVRLDASGDVPWAR